jgi:hypothetical protein
MNETPCGVGGWVRGSSKQARSSRHITRSTRRHCALYLLGAFFQNLNRPSRLTSTALPKNLVKVPCAGIVCVIIMI